MRGFTVALTSLVAYSLARPIQPTSQAIDSPPQGDPANLNMEARMLFLSAIERLEHPSSRSQDDAPKEVEEHSNDSLGSNQRSDDEDNDLIPVEEKRKANIQETSYTQETEDSEQGISNNQETEESEQGISNNQETEDSEQGTSDDQEIDDEADTEDDTYDNDTSDNGTSDNEIMPRSINEGDDPNKVSDIQFLKEAVTDLEEFEKSKSQTP
ncbi:hypothetical protein DSO57_1033363 [Entomophthora muscae]|uniref:Uncharacterized protein n=1 Tax=Entomophthora muscae TaxID=34485 RepID=A0ACC2TYQ2_9FUNG|nr:hypothetical protein DSO57_1033363 [Entomophthora muscae]